MPQISEATGVDQIASVVQAGAEQISRNQTITFTKFIRLVLPADGFIFWVQASILPNSTILQALGLPVDTPESQWPANMTAANTLTASGSLHYTTDREQDEDNGFDVNHMVFTSETDLDDFDQTEPVICYLGQFDGLWFQFRRLTMLYRQSALFHYEGRALFPSMQSQVITDITQLNLTDAVVSNSLPIWLTLNQYCPMYPSYLVPDNATLPWCAVHIEPDDTEALQSAPYIDPVTGTPWQLCSDRVVLTFFGLRNKDALQFLTYLLDFAENSGKMGIMNVPTVRDEKATQSELNIIAQKKRMVVEVNYYQTVALSTALKYIESAFDTLYLDIPNTGESGLDFSNPDNSALIGH